MNENVCLALRLPSVLFGSSETHDKDDLCDPTLLIETPFL